MGWRCRCRGGRGWEGEKRAWDGEVWGEMGVVGGDLGRCAPAIEQLHLLHLALLALLALLAVLLYARESLALVSNGGGEAR